MVDRIQYSGNICYTKSCVSSGFAKHHPNRGLKMMGFHAFHPPFCVHLEGTNTLLVPIDDDRIYLYTLYLH